MEYYNKLFGCKWNSPRTHSKTHWSFLKTLINSKSVSLISEIQIGGNVITIFTEKIFNKHFAKQCRANHNISLILNRNNFYTNERLNNVRFLQTISTQLSEKSLMSASFKLVWWLHKNFGQIINNGTCIFENLTVNVVV